MGTELTQTQSSLPSRLASGTRRPAEKQTARTLPGEGHKPSEQSATSASSVAFLVHAFFCVLGLYIGTLPGCHALANLENCDKVDVGKLACSFFQTGPFLFGVPQILRDLLLLRTQLCLLVFETIDRLQKELPVSLPNVEGCGLLRRLCVGGARGRSARPAHRGRAIGARARGTGSLEDLTTIGHGTEDTGAAPLDAAGPPACGTHCTCCLSPARLCRTNFETVAKTASVGIVAPAGQISCNIAKVGRPSPTGGAAANLSFPRTD